MGLKTASMHTVRAPPQEAHSMCGHYFQLTFTTALGFFFFNITYVSHHYLDAVCSIFISLLLT